jgi:hypothetical protein
MDLAGWQRSRDVGFSFGDVTAIPAGDARLRSARCSPVGVIDVFAIWDRPSSPPGVARRVRGHADPRRVQDSTVLPTAPVRPRRRGGVVMGGIDAQRQRKAVRTCAPRPDGARGARASCASA